MPVNKTPVITSVLTFTGRVGIPFRYQITATHNPTSFSASGLPAGVSVNTRTGVISGTPTTSSGSPFSATIGATNAHGTGNDTLVITITTADVPIITSPLLIQASFGLAFSYQITATNSPTSYDADPLPEGLSVNTTTGKITGRPTQVGSFEITLSATNGGGTGTAVLTITVAFAKPVITSTLTAEATIGDSFSYQITATNHPTSYGVSSLTTSSPSLNTSSLPANLSVNTSTGVISGELDVSGTFTILVSATNMSGTGSAKLVLTVAQQVNSRKEVPAGNVLLVPAISQINPIGTITTHAWTSTLMDGVRIRIAWKDIELADGVYDWSLIDECLELAGLSDKWIGIGITAGVGCPGWLYGGDTYTDGIVTGFTVQSDTASFVNGDIGKILYCDRYSDGYATITDVTSTVATVDTKAFSTATQVRFSVLARHSGSPFRPLTPDGGIMSVPWNTTFKTKWLRLIAAAGDRYDDNPLVQYIAMGGMGRTGETRCADEASDVAWFDADAVSSGFSAGGGESAAVVAWKDASSDIVDAYMDAFPNTYSFITGAGPFPNTSGGDLGIADLSDAILVTYQERIGFLNAQMNPNVNTGWGSFSYIYDNRMTNPTGSQFLSSAGTTCATCFLCLCDGTSQGCGDFGEHPCLSSFDAMNNTLVAGVAIGCKFLEIYEIDVKNPSFAAIMSTARSGLKDNANNWLP